MLAKSYILLALYMVTRPTCPSSGALFCGHISYCLLSYGWIRSRKTAHSLLALLIKWSGKFIILYVWNEKKPLYMYRF